MGMYANLRVYDVDELKKYTVEKCGEDSLTILEKAMNYFGLVAGDKFIVVSDEHSEDYNSSWEFPKAIGAAFGLPWGEYDPKPSYVDCHGNAYDFLLDNDIEYDGESWL